MRGFASALPRGDGVFHVDGIAIPCGSELACNAFPYAPAMLQEREQGDSGTCGGFEFALTVLRKEIVNVSDGDIFEEKLHYAEFFLCSWVRRAVCGHQKWVGPAN